MNAYVIAVDAVWDSTSSAHTSAEVRSLLQEYSVLLARLREAGPLSEKELSTAQHLRNFFLSLGQAGDAEAYGEHVKFEPPPIDMTR